MAMSKDAFERVVVMSIVRHLRGLPPLVPKRFRIAKIAPEVSDPTSPKSQLAYTDPIDDNEPS